MRSMDRQICSGCGEYRSLGWRAGLCPACREAAERERSALERHERALQAIRVADLGECEHEIRRVERLYEIGRAFRGEAAALARLQERARAAAQRLRELRSTRRVTRLAS